MKFFVLWFMIYPTVTLNYLTVILRYVITGQTKNQVDGEFLLIERKIKCQDTMSNGQGCPHRVQ